MNDFLKNLRSSYKKDTSNPKRNLDGHFYPNDNRRKTMDRRSENTSNSLEILYETLIDVLPRISDTSSDLSLFLDQISGKTDKLIDAQIRQHTAVANFFENLNMFLENADTTTPSPPVKVSASYTTGTHYTKDEILETMQSLRKQDMTFAQIAKHLTEKGIPTFSGKGQWHAQTIHRLCK